MTNGSHRRRHKRRSMGSRFLAVTAILLLLLSSVLMVIGFFPGVRQKVYAALPVLKEVRKEAGDDAGKAFTEEETGSEVLPEETGNNSGETRTGEVQQIFVARSDGTNGPGAASSTDPLVFTFAGDILFDDKYSVMASNLERNGHMPDVVASFDDQLLKIMQSADVFMVNNEFPYSDRGAPLTGKKFTFRAKPAYAAQLLDLGVDIVALANNHMYDYGQQALLDTLDTLDALQADKAGSLRVITEGSGTGQQGADLATGMPHVGAGRNIEEAAAPVYFTNGKIKVGIIAATQIERMGNPDTKGATETEAGVFRCLKSAQLVEKIKEMRGQCDFIIAYLHWGTESTTAVDEHQKKLADEVSKAGADLIIGDHPHVLQKISMVNGVPVIYSLGNFWFNSNAQDTGLFTARLDPQTGSLLGLQFVPARQENCRTFLLEGSEKERVLKEMRTMSDVEIDEEGQISLP